MALSKFGQYVILTVRDEEGLLVFETDGLRVDFDVRHTNGFSRCKIDVYNLGPDTIKALSGKNKYATIKVALHDGVVSNLINNFYISNVLESPAAPHSITSLYTFSSTRVKYLERQINTVVALPSLKRVVGELVRVVEFPGRVEYKNFPSTMVDYIPPNPLSNQRGSLQTCLSNLSDQFGFNVYTVDDDLWLVYKPNTKNVVDTGLYTSSGDIRLSTTEMRSNPKIGPATLSIEANLNKNIKPSSILNIADLLYATTDADQDILEVSKQYLEKKVAGFSKYQALAVQHKGSNFTNVWVTAAMAVAPTPGNNMPTNAWFK